MGDYNPHAPYILGQEWVPIRDENVILPPLASQDETGTTFTLTQATAVGSARVYANTFPPGFSSGRLTVNVYSANPPPQGPIRQVIIPVAYAAPTGTGSSGSTAELYNPGDGLDIRFTTADGTAKSIGLMFSINTYIQALANKRILDVGLLYSGFATAAMPTGSDDALPMTIQQGMAPNQGIRAIVRSYALTSTGTTYGPLEYLFLNAPLEVPQTDIAGIAAGRATVNYLSLGLVSPSSDPNAAWFGTLAGLQQFAPGGGRLLVLFCTLDSRLPGGTTGPAGDTVFATGYASLCVTFCEETRVATGTTNASINQMVNYVPLQHPQTAVANPILQPGSYLMTVASGNIGQPSSGFYNNSNAAKLNALREIYTVTHQGVDIKIPTPVHEHVNEPIVYEETHILPQLSLHASGSAGTTLTEPHVYGRQVAAEIYGSVYAEQELLGTIVGTDAVFPWVRFYARRWGETTQPLELTGNGGLAGSSVSITPDEFDELPEILDGWKEVTLRFDTPPTMGTSTPTATWRWTSVGELIGNRWEVLGASAPALSGVPGNLYNLAPATQQLYSATYEAPTGSSQELAWTPQGINTPPTTGIGSEDDSADATILFAQDPPDVTGFSVTTLCQPLSGIGPECDVDPCCIPSAVYFNQISWSAISSPPQSGFGFYELQRSDSVDSEWQTIMEASSITGSSFNDFEARVGIDTLYRIRAVDVYGFYGSWSSEISATITEPGVTIGCRGDGHLLIFTSNENQCGDYTLAYSNAWESGEQVVEDFTFPEAGFTQLQPMYDRDYFTAFRPTERGGEQFQRNILVQAAAISPPTLGDFQSLRDMAWDNVNYVCVRDEEGNRWFANVTVPSGRVMRNRNIYMAPVQVREVTATPTPVDPDNCSSTGQVCEDPFTCDEIVGLDQFNRSVTGEWGEADEGGDWESGE